jgi:hypothetical protein
MQKQKQMNGNSKKTKKKKKTQPGPVSHNHNHSHKPKQPKQKQGPWAFETEAASTPVVRCGSLLFVVFAIAMWASCQGSFVVFVVCVFLFLLLVYIHLNLSRCHFAVTYLRPWNCRSMLHTAVTPH